MFLRKSVLKICSKFTVEYPYQSAISTIALRHGRSPVNLLHIFRTPFLMNTSWKLLLSHKIKNHQQKYMIQITLELWNINVGIGDSENLRERGAIEREIRIS